MLLLQILLMGILTTVAFVSQTAALPDKNDIDDKTPSVVSRLDPVLRKALLQALSNLERNSSEDENAEGETTTATTFNEEILEESTTSDQTPAVQYHSFVVQNNDTATSNDDSEIIQTIIVKAPRPTVSSLDVDEVSEQSDNDVIIKFDKLDPVKESDIRVETVQVARSVSSSIKTNEINGETDDDISEKQSTKSLKKATTYKPTTTTSTTTTTTTEAPTHNEDGENIERVKENDVKIYQAPLVTAFTIQQDGNGLPKNVIPLYKQDVVPASMSQPVEQFSFTSQVHPTTQNFQNIPIQSNRNTQPPPQFSVQQSVQPQPPVFNVNTFALEQKQRQLEQQIVYLQEQQRKQEVLFRQQQSYQDQQALQRQAQLLLEQRLRIEEDYRLRQQKYEDELKAYKEKQQQQLQSRFNQPSVVVEGQSTPNSQVKANSQIDVQQQQLSVQQLPVQVQQQLPAEQQSPVQQQLPVQHHLPVEQQLPATQPPQQFAPQTNQQNIQVQHQTITEVQNQQQLNVQPIQQSSQSQQDIERQRQELQREIVRQNEEYHQKQIKYQQDLATYKQKQREFAEQQQQQQQQFFSRQQLPFLPAQQFAPSQQPTFNQGLPQQQQQVRFNNNNNNQNQFRTSVQIVPSVQFPSFQVPTQQMLPIREPQTFRSRSHNEFQQQQTNIPPQLSSVQELPQRSFQQFHSGPIIQNSNIDPVIAAPPDSIQRNRVFRQETDTANFFNSVNNNRITLNPVNNNADNYLQSLLFQSGISGRQNEDLNIITKVLALNHGIQSSPNDQQQIRFPRRENV